MALPYSNLETKLEAAAKYILDAEGLGYNCTTGLSGETKELPHVIVHAEKGSETPLNSGNYKLKLTISVMDSCDRVAIGTHRDGAGQVFDVFLDEELAASLSAVTAAQAAGVNGFHIFQVQGRNGSATRVEDRQFISEISVDLYGCAADIT